MIDSLKPQLKQGDALTIVFDGPKAFEKSGFKDEWLQGFNAATKVITHEKNLGFWGHGIANEYQGKLEPATTFVMHADDDDKYVQNAFDELRTKCIDPECLYIAKMKDVRTGEAIPRYPTIAFANIGTPCGIIPFAIRDAAKWGHIHGGDFTFYDALSKAAKRVEFLPTIHYEVIRDQGDVKIGGAKAQLNPTL